MSRIGSNFSKGLYVYGAPVLPSAGADIFMGNVYFVDSGNVDGADDVGTAGKTKDRPFSTVDYALNQCTSDNGDVIYVMPGHTESISTSGTLIPDIDGVSIIGLGRGTDRPTFTATSSGDMFITGEATRISNCIFQAGATGTYYRMNPFMTIAARDVQIDNCEFRNGGSSSFYDECIKIGSTTVKFDNVALLYNRFLFIDTTSSGTHKGIVLGNDSTDGSIISDGISIVGNQISGVVQEAGIYSYSSGNLHTNLNISHNKIYLGPTGGSSALCIDLNSALTGVLHGNVLTNVTGTNIASLLDPGSLLCTENYGANAINETGVVVPQAAAT